MNRTHGWIAATLTVVALTGCGGGGTTSPPPTEAPAAVNTGALAKGVRILTDAENAAFVEQVGSDITYSGTLSFNAGDVVLGQDVAFKVVSTTSDGSTTVVSTSDPAIEELFTVLRIQGTFMATSAQFIGSTRRASAAPTASAGAPTARAEATSPTNFTWPFKLEGGGAVLDNELKGTMTATVNYDFQASKGGLQSAQFDVDTTAELTSTVTLGEGAKLDLEERVGYVRIPISVSVVDSLLSLVGVRLVSVYVPFYVGVSSTTNVKLGLKHVATGAGQLHARYDSINGATATDTYTGTSSNVFEAVTAPSGAPAFATYTEKLTVYVRTAPSLAFLNSAALLGIGVKVSADDTGVVQIVPDSPGYCFTLAPSANLKVDGFFKTVGHSWSTPPYTKNLYKPSSPLTWGTCKAPVFADIVATSPASIVFGKPVTLMTSISQDLTVPFSAPSTPPTGTVQIAVDNRTCSATLDTPATASSIGSCTLTPLTTGEFVDVVLTYSGDSAYASSVQHVPIKVNKSDSVLAMSTNPNPSSDGSSVTLAATALPSPSGEGEATGTIDFKDSTGATLCTATIASAGTGNCKAAINGEGTKSLSAAYNGDANFKGSTSAAYTHTVALAPPPGFWEGSIHETACNAPGSYGTNADLINCTMGGYGFDSFFYSWFALGENLVSDNFVHQYDINNGTSTRQTIRTTSPFDSTTASFSTSLDTDGVDSFANIGRTSPRVVFVVTSRTAGSMAGTYSMTFTYVACVDQACGVKQNMNGTAAGSWSAVRKDGALPVPTGVSPGKICSSYGGSGYSPTGCAFTTNLRN